jgi:hypothetical protein
MKKSILSLAAIGLTALAAHATPVTASIGDVFVGFEDVVQNKNYLVDIGTGSFVTSLASSNNGTAITASLAGDLSTVFGTNWASNTNLFFGVFGVNSAKSGVWASTASGNGAFPFKSSGALSTTLTYYTTMLNNYNAELSSQGLTNGVYFNVGSGLDQGHATWTGNIPTASGGTAFAVYNQSLEVAVTASPSAFLDLYQTGANVGSTTKILNQSLFGNALGINLNASSANYGAIQVIPEPSTYALLGLGALLLVLAARRRA